MWTQYINASTVDEAVEILSTCSGRARVVAGATDLILEMERGVRRGIETLIDITRVPLLDQIHLDEEDVIHIGPLVTHNQCAASKLIVERAFPLARATWEVGAPQIRNRGTIVGNIITASPANDTIPPLLALEAQVTLLSRSGKRVVPLEEFYLGVRKTIMRPDEILVDIAFPALKRHQRGTFIKLGLRRAQAISLVNAAVILTMEGEQVIRAAITLGAVAPTIIHAVEAEHYLEGKILDARTIAEAAKIAAQAARSIDDVRGSAAYRNEMVRVSIRRVLASLAVHQERMGYPMSPVRLWGDNKDGQPPSLAFSSRHTTGEAIHTRINGQEYVFNTGQDKTLLRLLREEAGLIGTKEGCAEGECGACTVFLDGIAVMSCLVPAPRAHGAEIITVEGLAVGGQLHPVQQAFIDEGAVQCGYCTPGFIMSGVKLLEERPNPTVEEIKSALTGNLCRCTGYYSIIKAIETAAKYQTA